MFEYPNEKIPNIGERVVVLVIKEMIYMGNDHDSGSDWLDDGKGRRTLLCWTNLKNDPTTSDTQGSIK